VRDVAALGGVVLITFGVLLSPWLLAFGPEGALQVSIYMCVYIYVCIHTYIYIYIHVYVHINLYIPT
jgi:hypothetical protein